MVQSETVEGKEHKAMRDAVGVHFPPTCFMWGVTPPAIHTLVLSHAPLWLANLVQNSEFQAVTNFDQEEIVRDLKGRVLAVYRLPHDARLHVATYHAHVSPHSAVHVDYPRSFTRRPVSSR
jgi:hypothetical protein